MHEETKILPVKKHKIMLSSSFWDVIVIIIQITSRHKWRFPRNMSQINFHLYKESIRNMRDKLNRPPLIAEIQKKICRSGAKDWMLTSLVQTCQFDLTFRQDPHDIHNVFSYSAISTFLGHMNFRAYPTYVTVPLSRTKELNSQKVRLCKICQICRILQ